MTRFCLHHGERSTNKSDGTDAGVHGTSRSPRGAFGIRSDRHGDLVARTLVPIDGAFGLVFGRLRGGRARGGGRGRGSRRHGCFLGAAAGNAGVGVIDLGLTASERRRGFEEGNVAVHYDYAAGAFCCAISNGGSFHAHVAIIRKIVSFTGKGITAADGGALVGASLGNCGGCWMVVDKGSRSKPEFDCNTG